MELELVRILLRFAREETSTPLVWLLLGLVIGMVVALRLVVRWRRNGRR